MGDNIVDSSQYDALFASAFPKDEYPILTRIWDENKDRASGASAVTTETEDYLTDPDLSVEALRAAQSELKERWTKENIAKRTNEAFTPFIGRLNKAEQAQALDQLQTQLTGVLQSVVIEKKAGLLALVDERLQESLPWYDREWQGLKLMWWAVIGGIVLLFIIILIAAGGKKAYNQYGAPPIAMPPPVAPQYQMRGGQFY
jgi:hypothetical protein